MTEQVVRLLALSTLNSCQLHKATAANKVTAQYTWSKCKRKLKLKLNSNDFNECVERDF